MKFKRPHKAWQIAAHELASTAAGNGFDWRKSSDESIFEMLGQSYTPRVLAMIKNEAASMLAEKIAEHQEAMKWASKLS